MRRFPGMERLAHGAEHRFEAGRLGSGDAQRQRRPLRVQSQEMSGRRRGTETADRGGAVEAAGVVAGCHQGADAAERLVAGDESGDHRLAVGALRLAQRQQHRQDRHAGMAAHGHVDVVEVERVRSGAVDQRRQLRRRARAMPDERRLRRAALFERLGEEDLRERLARARDGHGEEIEDALPRQQADVRGEVVVAQRGDAAGKLGGEGNVGGDGWRGCSRSHGFLLVFAKAGTTVAARPARQRAVPTQAEINREAARR